MKLLTRNTDYAVRAVCAMASKPGRSSTVTALVKDLKIPRPFLRKILQRLGKTGVVESTRGLGGGFRLASRPDKLTLADFIEAFQGPLKINECSFKKKRCPNTVGCPLKRKIDKIAEYVEKELRAVTLAELLKKPVIGNR